MGFYIDGRINDTDKLEFVCKYTSFKKYFYKLIGSYSIILNLKREKYITKNYSNFLSMRTIYNLIDNYINYKKERTDKNLKAILLSISDNEDFDYFINIDSCLGIDIKKNFFKKYYLKVSLVNDYRKEYFLREDYFLVSVVLENIEGNFYMYLKIEEEYNNIEIFKSLNDNICQSIF